MSRRRKLRLLRTALVVVVVAVVVGSVLAIGRGSPAPARAAGHPKAVQTHTAAASSPVVDPFTRPVVERYLAAHPGITAAVHDQSGGTVWTYHPTRRATTASIMKVDILETLLHQEGVLHGDLLVVATGMIENSNNDDAQELWDREGGASAVSAYNDLAGLDGTTPNTAGYWGLSTTSATDQVRLLDHLAVANPLLSTPERHQALDLMHHVESDQQWGVSAGLPKAASVAIKNGWLPLDDGDGWEVNSDGIVTGAGYDDDLSVLTTGSATEAAGIQVIEGLTRLIWPGLA
jgi:beta-lactamase class A